MITRLSENTYACDGPVESKVLAERSPTSSLQPDADPKGTNSEDGALEDGGSPQHASPLELALTSERAMNVVIGH